MYVMDTRRIRKRIEEITTAESVSQFLMKEIATKIEFGISVDEASFEVIVENMKKLHAADGVNLTHEQGILGTMVTSIIDESGYGDIVPDSIYDLIIDEGKVFKRGDIESNPYFKNIRLDEKRIGRFRLSHEKYDKYEPFMYSSPSIQRGVAIPRIGCFGYQFTYPVIGEYDGEHWRAWMSITPNEIFTMKEPIKAASGNVLTLGCGMGYFAYMAALKGDVAKVTIVEKSPEVIELFKTEILPQFSVKDKIEIIEADAFDYMEQLEDGMFDYCFADIWYGNIDPIPYLKLKKICAKFNKMRMSYWLEDAIVQTMMSIVVAEIIDAYEETDYMVQKTLDAPEEYAARFRIIKELLADVQITKPEQLDYYLDWRNIAYLLGRRK